MNLSYEIEIDDPVIIFSLTGKITTDLDFEDLETDVFNHLNQNYYRVIFNIEKLTHTNSSGIGFIMRTLTKTRIMGGELILVGINGNVKKIFEIAKLDEIYTLYDSKEEALNHFKELK